MDTRNPLDALPRNAVGHQTGAHTWDPLTRGPREVQTRVCRRAGVGRGGHLLTGSLWPSRPSVLD